MNTNGGTNQRNKALEVLIQEFIILIDQRVDEKIGDRFLNSEPDVIPEKEPVILNGEQLRHKLNVTRQTLINWRNKGRIPYFQIGSAIRYDLNVVLKAIEKKGPSYL